MSEKIRLQIGGMTCQACANRIEKVLNRKDFVQHAEVNYANEEAHIEYDSSQADAEQLIAIIEKTGYTAQQATEAVVPLQQEGVDWRLWVLLAVNIPFIVGMIGMMFGVHYLMMPPLWQLILASVVQWWLAVPFYRSAWASIKGGLANMDVLVTLGTVATYLDSAYTLLVKHDAHHVYFEAGVMVVGFVSLGKFLEHRVKHNSLNSLGLLLQLTPKLVQMQTDNGWTRRPLDQVTIGSVLKADSGERIAADGEVLSGSGYADESHLTGEPIPKHKQNGSKVLAGALMTDGSIVYRAEQLGKETLLGDMMGALADAQGSKAPIARIADKAAAVFVPVVVTLSLITLAVTFWVSGSWEQALMHAVAVLVIACPCALGLATPAAIMVGMGKAVNMGVWFKDAAAMEHSSRINMVALDKTGTLTEGKPKVQEIAVWAEGWTAERILQVAASVEHHANHPLARAIVDAAAERQLSLLPVAQVGNVDGAGITAQTEEWGEIRIGKPSFCGVDRLPEAEKWSAFSVAAVAFNGQAVGALALADGLKADSLQAVRRLQANGIDVCIISGDHQQAVDHIAAQLDIQQAFGDMSPRDKLSKIRALQSQGKIVAMVGDGVNDAAALAAADVGFAMKGGADVAENSAAVTLMRHSVDQLADALLLARTTMTNIRQNLFFAFVYNIIGIPLAALGWLTPVLAGAAMALSSISVLSNALRLRTQKIG